MNSPRATTKMAFAFLGVAVAALGASAFSPPFQLTWYTTASGGAIGAASGSGRFSLNASAAQIDGTAPIYADGYNLQPGFWGGDPPCVADRNGDYTVDLLDFFAFFNCWDATDPCADIDGSGSVDLIDFFAFFNAWDLSC